MGGVSTGVGGRTMIGADVSWIPSVRMPYAGSIPVTEETMCAEPLTLVPVTFSTKSVEAMMRSPVWVIVTFVAGVPAPSEASRPRTRTRRLPLTPHLRPPDSAPGDFVVWQPVNLGITTHPACGAALA